MSGQHSTFKLHYFNAKALGEPIRILFAYGGIKYEDIRYDRFGDEWPKIKNSFPMGTLPVLEIDDVRVSQSLAITRYIARLVGLAGSNDWENLLIDIAVNNISEFRTKIPFARWEPNEKIRQQKMAELKDQLVSFYLKKWDAAAHENNGYLALGRLTWADIYFVGVYEFFGFVFGLNVTENHPHLKRVISNVYSIESIKNWIEKRPKTDF